MKYRDRPDKLKEHMPYSDTSDPIVEEMPTSLLANNGSSLISSRSEQILPVYSEEDIL